MKKSWGYIFLALIILLSFLLRINGLNWDSNFHLHPDERFLTLVSGSMKMPANLFEYLDPNTSLFNPKNIDYAFFVYGRFPLILNKFLANFFGNDTYNMFTIQGRLLSAFADFFVVILIFKTVELLEKKYKLKASLKYLAAFLYGIAVLPIQLAHFFTVDSFLNFFCFASFYFALKFGYSSSKDGYHLEPVKVEKNVLDKTRTINLVLSAVFFGFGLASKVTAVFIAPLVFYLIWSAFPKELKKVISYLFIFGLVAYGSLRLADPYLFESSNPLNPTISQTLIQNLKTLQSYDRPDIWFPPAVQWLKLQPVLYSLQNLAIFGVGLPIFILFLLGIYLARAKKKSNELTAAIIWIGGFFLWQSTQVTQPMRYFILIYPFLAIFAAFGLQRFLDKVFSLTGNTQRAALAIIIFALILSWPLAFSSIYINKHSRVEASEWIYQNLPNGSLILGEHWDDQLPLQVPQTFGKQFKTLQLPVFDPDNPQKWRTMADFLDQADYYIPSSNRGWGSITRVPQRYPLMSKFYTDLFSDRLRYKKVKAFTPSPSLRYLGLPIDFPDQWADESFTVYDHPEVTVFTNFSKLR